MEGKSLLLIISTVVLMNCIGTDQVEDTVNSVKIVPPENVTVVNDGNFAKVLGQEALLEAEAKSDLGGAFMVVDNLVWQSGDENIALVDGDGLVTAVGVGSTTISVTFTPDNGNAVTDLVTISVAGDQEAAVLIEITSPDNQLVIDPGTQLQLTGTPLNAAGIEVEMVAPLEWTSSDLGVATVDNTGRVTALAAGEVTISAAMNDIVGELNLLVDSGDDEESALTRTAEFRGLSGYNVSGDAALTTNSDGSLTLQLEEDFRASPGPGLYLYLSNSPSQISGGVEISELDATSGEQEYAVPDGVSLSQYQHIVLYCKPFGVGFGTAELSE